MYEICAKTFFQYFNYFAILFLEIPVFLVLTNVDKCNLTEKGLEEKKNDICLAMNIEPYKVIMCSNYQPDDKPNIEKDIKVLEFLAKVNSLCLNCSSIHVQLYRSFEALITCMKH